MPNWCSNRLVVRGTPEQLARFRETASGSERPDFIVQETEARHILERMSAHDRLALTAPAEARRAELLAKAGLPEEALTLDRMIAHLWRAQQAGEAADPEEADDPLLFNFHRILPVPLEMQINEPTRLPWTVTLWGTRGMLENADIELLDEEDHPGQLTYSFDTAWSPPSAVVRRLIELLPDVAIALVYTEPGNDFCGAIWNTGGGNAEEAERRPSEFAPETDDPDDSDDESLVEFVSSADVLDILYETYVPHAS